MSKLNDDPEVSGILHRSPHDHIEDSTPDEIRESAYRRGYHQALHQVHEAMVNDRIKPGHMCRWFRRVSSWRFRLGDRSKAVVPPPPQWGFSHGRYGPNGPDINLGTWD